MSRKILNNDLKKLIKSPQTVHNWHEKNPRGMLKFAPEIVCQCDITWTQLAGEVLMRENELYLKKN